MVSVLPVATGERRPEASGAPELHDVESGVADMCSLVADELARRAQHLELDAFLERVCQFLDARRHFLAGAAIDDGDVAAQTLGGARRVHRGVAAADDDDLLVLHVGSGVS